VGPVSRTTRLQTRFEVAAEGRGERGGKGLVADASMTGVAWGHEMFPSSRGQIQDGESMLEPVKEDMLGFVQGLFDHNGTELRSGDDAATDLMILETLDAFDDCIFSVDTENAAPLHSGYEANASFTAPAAQSSFKHENLRQQQVEVNQQRSGSVPEEGVQEAKEEQEDTEEADEEWEPAPKRSRSSRNRSVKRRSTELSLPSAGGADDPSDEEFYDGSESAIGSESDFSECGTPTSNVNINKRKRQPPRQLSIDDQSVSSASSEPCHSPMGGRRGWGKKNARRWTAEEDEQLRHAVAKHKEQNWKAIAKMVENRDHVQCLQRWKKVLQPGLKKGMWKKEEDELLMKLMMTTKPKNWADVAAKVPGRTAKQCRERWSLNLDPTINHDAWTAGEDDLLDRLHAEMGNKWSEIKRFLPGRTENGVKTRFKSNQRARKRDDVTKWTADLEQELHNISVKFDSKIEIVAKHLPRKLRGISFRAMREHCELLQQADEELERRAAERRSAALSSGLRDNPLVKQRHESSV